MTKVKSAGRLVLQAHDSNGSETEKKRWGQKKRRRQKNMKKRERKTKGGNF